MNNDTSKPTFSLSVLQVVYLFLCLLSFGFNAAWIVTLVYQIL